jgi:outer membrane protein insertion porin family
MNDVTVCRCFLRAACFALALAPLGGLAQVNASTLEKPRMVGKVTIKAERIVPEKDGETLPAPEAFILGHVALRAGEPFSKDAITRTVRSLYATGRFNQVRVVPSLDPQTGQVNLEITVEPRPILREIIAGGKLIDLESDALKVAGFSVGEPLDDAAMKRAVLALQKELRKERPFIVLEAKTKPEVKGLPGVRVELTASESPRLTIDFIRIEGTAALTENEIIEGAEMKTEKPGFFSRLFGGVFFTTNLDTEEYRRDCNRIRDFYRLKGFLDVEVEDPDPAMVCRQKDLKDGSGKLEVIFKVKEGRRYTIGALDFSGNKLGATNPVFTTEALQQVVASPSLRRGAYRPEVDRFITGEAFATVALDTATEKLREYYGQMGYQNIQVEALRAPNFLTGAIAVSFKIQEGERFTIRSLDIQGNTKTRSTVIARELALSPGEVFDLARVRVSEARLEGTQFFTEVRLIPVPSPVPNQSDLRVIVKEGSTGSVSFGAGYSTVEQLVGFVEYSEGNFDYTNPEGWYRGGGQKFRVKLQAGSVSNSFEHSFEEPSLWERDLAVGYKIERRYTGYSSANYNVVNEGVGVYARRRLFSTVEGRIAYDLRRVSVGNVTATAPLDVQAEGGHPKTISSVTLSLTHDSRDQLNFPTKGSRLSLSEEIAGNGLGGSLDYFKTELRMGKWFLLSPTREQTLGLLGRVGTIGGSGGYVPFYERFFLGGAYDMRGFDYNEVGEASTWDTTNGNQPVVPPPVVPPWGPPYQTNVNQPVGGMTYGYLSAEYTIKMADNFRLAAFYDYGFVNKDALNFSLSQANSDIGVGMRILLGGAVMRLDFGFPLQTTKNPATGAELNAGGMKFNFSFGTVF